MSLNIFVLQASLMVAVETAASVTPTGETVTDPKLTLVLPAALEGRAKLTKGALKMMLALAAGS